MKTILFVIVASIFLAILSIACHKEAREETN